MRAEPSPFVTTTQQPHCIFFFLYAFASSSITTPQPCFLCFRLFAEVNRVACHARRRRRQRRELPDDEYVAKQLPRIERVPKKRPVLHSKSSRAGLVRHVFCVPMKNWLPRRESPFTCHPLNASLPGCCVLHQANLLPPPTNPTPPLPTPIPRAANIVGKRYVNGYNCPFRL